MLTSYSVCIMILYVIYGYDAAIGHKFTQNSWHSLQANDEAFSFCFVNKSICICICISIFAGFVRSQQLLPNILLVKIFE